jgi:hypothetical protein
MHHYSLIIYEFRLEFDSYLIIFKSPIAIPLKLDYRGLY